LGPRRALSREDLKKNSKDDLIKRIKEKTQKFTQLNYLNCP